MEGGWGWLVAAAPLPHPLTQSRVMLNQAVVLAHAIPKPGPTKSRTRKSFPSLSRIILFLTQSLPFRLEGFHERGCVLYNLEQEI